MTDTVLRREGAVALLRKRLLEWTEEGKSVCRIAAEKNVFCRGFDRDGDEALRRRYDGVIEDVGSLTRPQLEEAANRWQLHRQREEGALLCCEVQYRYYQTCRGWDDFSNEELERFCKEMLGIEVLVVGSKNMPVM